MVFIIHVEDKRLPSKQDIYAVLLVAHRLRLWPIIKLALYQRLVFTAWVDATQQTYNIEPMLF